MQKKLSQKIAQVLWVYIKTQFMLILLVTFISWSMLSLLGVQYALLLGFATGSASVVPILGLGVTAIIAAIVAIFDSTRFLPHIPSFFEGLIVVILYGLLNFVVDYFLSPYLIGKSTNIHPLLLLIAVLLGTLAFGFVGTLFAIPAVLVIKTIIEDSHKKI